MQIGQRAPGRGIFVNDSDNAQLKNITIIGGDAMAHITGNGIDLVNAKNILVQNANISFVKDHGINIINTSTGTQLEKVTVTPYKVGFGSERYRMYGMNGHFTNVRIDRTGRQGIDVTNSKRPKVGMWVLVTQARLWLPEQPTVFLLIILKLHG